MSRPARPLVYRFQQKNVVRRISPDHSRYADTLPMPRAGLRDWLARTGFHHSQGAATARERHSALNRRPMSARQAERLRALLLFVRGFIAVHGRAPSTHEIQRGIHRASVSPRLRELERLGFVEITPRKKYGIRILPIQSD